MKSELVSKELYDALKRMQSTFKYDFDQIIQYACRFRFNGDLEILNELTLKQLSIYLLLGYQVRSVNDE